MISDIKARIVGLYGWSAAIVLFAVGMWTFPLALLGPDRFFVPGDLGDARFNNYILEHYHQYATGEVSEYWNAPFMYPWHDVIALSDNLLGTAPIYSLFRSLAFNRESAFQLWILALFALNFWCCFFALRAWCGRTVLAACGAFIFAFGIYGLGQMEHAQVYPRFMVPVVFYLTWKLLVTGRPWLLAMAALGVAYQFYCGIYLGFLLIYSVFFLVVAYVSFNWKGWAPRLKARSTWLAFAGVALASAILLAPLMLPYIQAANELGMREFDQVINSIPRPVSYFFAHPAALSWRDLSDHGLSAFPEWWNHFLFVGALPWFAVITGSMLVFIKRIPADQKRTIAILVVALMVSTVFCMNFGGLTLYKAFHVLPGFQALRSLDRIINVQIMFFILLFVAVVGMVRHRWLSIALAMLLPVLVVIDNRIDVTQMKVYDKWEGQALVNAIERHITAQYNGSEAIAYTPLLAVIDLERVHYRSISTNISAMLAAQQLRIPIVNGYTGSNPGNFVQFFDQMDEPALRDWCSFNNISCDGIQRINDLNIPFLHSDTMAIRSSDGAYVSVKSDGSANADRSTAYLWETFRVIYFHNDRIAFRSHLETFLAADVLGDGSITASAPLLGDHCIFAMEMQNDGWLILKAYNGKYVKASTVDGRLSATGERSEADLFRLAVLDH